MRRTGQRSSARRRARPDKLLGLFAYSNMNVAFDKIGGRRARRRRSWTNSGSPISPCSTKWPPVVLEVLAKNPRGFVAMIEGASIDKQAHLMDTDRWLLEMIEFDRAVQIAKDFADKHPDTIVIVTADHECAGAAIIGASTRPVACCGTPPRPGVEAQRDKIVGTYQASKFPKYKDARPTAIRQRPTSTTRDARGTPEPTPTATRPGFANVTPTRDTQQPFATVPR